MKEQAKERLEALRKEFEIGQAKLKEIEKEQAYLRQTMLRISGAIQVLEELLGEESKVKVEVAGATN